ncbi:DUF3261 domain-containing protein [Dongia sp.]|uniref:DUF3261 domain-containing protein n=1 Tax=Dongia sp. TaxID=1977262 RepID=UPI0035B339E4
MKRIGLILSLMLAACAAPPAPIGEQPFFAPGRALSLPAPGDLGRDVDWLQHLVIRRGAETFAFDVRLSVTAEKLHLLGLDGLGRRGIELTWERDGSITATRADWLPPEIQPGPMLADIILLYWPRDVLRRSLQAAGASLRDAGRSREVVADGRILLDISYGADGRVHYRNSAWGYTIDLRSAEVAP